MARLVRCDHCSEEVVGDDYGNPPHGWITLRRPSFIDVQLCSWLCVEAYATAQLPDPPAPTLAEVGVTMQTINDYDVTQAMLTYGGSFVEQLARTWRAADPANRLRIKAAFPDYWKNYAELRAREMARPLTPEEQAEKDAEMRSMRGYSDDEKAWI